MDAITLLTNDHHTVAALFDRFEATGDNAYVAKREIVGRIIEELSVHAAIEEQVFYPAVRRHVPGAGDLALESLEEHHVVKWLLSELEDLSPENERYTAKTTVLIENVRHHVKEEESELFPKVRHALSPTQLDEMGDALRHAKEHAPRRPHPRAPDSPPANLVTGPAAAVVDRVTEGIKDAASAAGALVSRSTEVPQEVVERTEQVATRTASRAKATAKATTRRATRTATSAKKTAKSARKAATSATRTPAAKRTAGSATKTAKSAKRTAKSARKAATSATRTPAAKRTAGSAKKTAKAAKRTAGSAKKAARPVKKTARTRRAA